MSMRTEILEGDLPQESWQALRDRVRPDEAFLTADWFAPWGRHLLKAQGWRGPLRYLVARDEYGGVAGVFPFATQTKVRATFVSLAGYYLPFRGIPVAVDVADEVHASFADALRGIAGVGVRIGPSPAADAIVGGFLAALERRGWRPVAKPISRSYVVHLPDSAAVLEKDILARSKRLWKAERKIQRDARAELQLYCSGDGGTDWQRVLDDLQKVERQSWQFREGGDLRFTGDANRGFWLELLSSPLAKGLVKVWLLFMDGAPVSLCLVIDSGPCRYQLINLYSETVKRYATGTMIFKQMFLDAIARGLRRVDLGLGDSGYKSEWGAVPERELVDWVIFRPGIRGWAFTQMFLLRDAVQRSRGNGVLGLLGRRKGCHKVLPKTAGENVG